MPSASVLSFEFIAFVVEGIADGSIKVEEGLGGGTWEGLEPEAGVRALRISRSSKSEPRSSMSPSEGSLSKSLSLTSSMRACDIVVIVRVLEERWWGVGGVWIFEVQIKLKRTERIWVRHVMR